MSRKSKNKKSVNRKVNPGVKPLDKTKAKAKSRRKLLKAGLISIAVIALGATGAMAYRSNHAQAHDLSVIGQGRPTVVQVHDPSCPDCNRLKANVNAVKGQFNGLDFRIASLKTTKGAIFARKHRAGKVTLLFFDAQGRLTETLNGVQSKDKLKDLFSRI